MINKDWVLLYQKIAEKLLDYEDKQKDIINIMKEGRKKEKILYIDFGNFFNKGMIDPFTFFSNFNRGIRFENRKKIFKDIIGKFKIDFDIKKIDEDFFVPTVNNQKSWFFNSKSKQIETDIKLLWELFKQGKRGEIKEDTFNKVLKINGIGISKITIGLFWIKPEKFISLDLNTINYIKNNYNLNINYDFDFDFKKYDNILKQLKSINENFISIVRKAYGNIGGLKITEQTKIFVDGFYSFISKYKYFPLSILITGDWGVGKTSLFSMLSNNIDIRKDYKIIKINTWAYSQNKKYKELILKKIIFEITEKHPLVEWLKKILFKERKNNFIDKILHYFFIKKIIFLINQIINLLNKIKLNIGFANLDLSKLEENERIVLKNNIEKEIKNKDKKIIIFIDDLDRLSPEYSVNILDLLKTFFYVGNSNIIFIIAADENIIKIGLKEKYKELKSSKISEKFYNNYFNKIFDLYLYPFPATKATIKKIIEEDHNKIYRKIKEDVDNLVKGLLIVGNENFRDIKKLLLKYELLLNVLDDEELDNFIDLLKFDLELNNEEKGDNVERLFINYQFSSHIDYRILYHFNNDLGIKMLNDTEKIKEKIEIINLKGIYSGPAPLKLILYYINNRYKTWIGLERQLKDKNKIYKWTFDFMKILNLVDSYDNENGIIKLTKEGEKIYDLIENKKYEIKYNEDLSENILKDNDLKYILKQQLLLTKGFIFIKNILLNKDITRNKLYTKLSEKLKVSENTLKNRVPSMLQLAEQLGILEERNGNIKLIEK